MHRCLKVLAALTIGLLASLPWNVQPRAGEPNPVTAIDILLEPDATMIEHAKAANQRLLKSFPIGFALDETHHPTRTCLGLVRTAFADFITGVRCASGASRRTTQAGARRRSIQARLNFGSGRGLPFDAYSVPNSTPLTAASM